MAKKKRSQPRPSSPPLSPAALLKLFKEVKRPMSRAEVIRRLKLKKKDKAVVKDLLKELVQKGKLVRIRRGYGLAEAMHCITGRLEIQRQGYGFVVPEDSRRKDVFVNQRDLNDAWHGDRVVVSVVGEPRGGRNAEGRIVRILERGRKVLPVKVVKKMTGGEWLCRPSDPRLNFGIIATLKDDSIRVRSGEIALCAPGERIDPNMWEGEITRRLGEETDIAVQEALVKSNHNIRTRFPSGSETQAESLPPEPSAKDFGGRRNLAEKEFVTIRRGHGPRLRRRGAGRAAQKRLPAVGGHRGRVPLRARGVAPGPRGVRARQFLLFPPVPWNPCSRRSCPTGSAP